MAFQNTTPVNVSIKTEVFNELNKEALRKGYKNIQYYINTLIAAEYEKLMRGKIPFSENPGL